MINSFILILIDALDKVINNIKYFFNIKHKKLIEKKLLIFQH